MFTPLHGARLTLKNRVVVSPMAQYSAVDGCPATATSCTWARARMGGAGAGDGRDDLRLARRAHHARLPGPVERRPARRLAAHRRLRARRDRRQDRLQLGHAGPKGSTNAPWEGAAPTGRWTTATGRCSPRRRCPTSPTSGQVPHAMTRADMDRVHADFVARHAPGRRGRLRLARAALRARLPAVELHLAADQPAQRRLRRHAREPAALSAGGVRRDARGLAGRQADLGAHLGARLGRAAASRPPTRCEIARAFKAAGADMIDCSSGQVSAAQQPIYGRMYQTPFADRIRNEAGIATIAVGAISRGRPRQQHHRRRPRRPLRGRPAAPGQPGLDADRGGAHRLHGASPGRSRTARPQSAARSRRSQRERRRAAGQAEGSTASSASRRQPRGSLSAGRRPGPRGARRG